METKEKTKSSCTGKRSRVGRIVVTSYPLITIISNYYIYPRNEGSRGDMGTCPTALQTGKKYLNWKTDENFAKKIQ